jgi:hypothetical protein
MAQQVTMRIMRYCSWPVVDATRTPSPFPWNYVFPIIFLTGQLRSTQVQSGPLLQSYRSWGDSGNNFQLPAPELLQKLRAHPAASVYHSRPLIHCTEAPKHLLLGVSLDLFSC